MSRRRGVDSTFKGAGPAMLEVGDWASRCLRECGNGSNGSQGGRKRREVSSQQKTMHEKSCMALLQQPKASQSPAASLLPVLPIGVVPSAGRKASGAVDRAAKSVVAAKVGVGHTRTREAQVPILSRALSNIDPGVLRDALPPAIKGAVLVAESQWAALAAVSSKRRSVDDRAFVSAVMTAKCRGARYAWADETEGRCSRQAASLYCALQNQASWSRAVLCPS